MSSSTMMNGPSMPRASQARTAKERMTMAASAAQAGTALRRSTTELDLAEAGRDDARLVGAGLDPHLGSRLADVTQHGVRDGTTAGGELEGRNVEIGHAIEVVLRASEVESRGAHRRPNVRARREQVERRYERVDLVVVDRHLQRHVIRQLREPADIADDERLAERERANGGAGRLAHRRPTQVDVHVARLHQPPQPALVHEA